MKPKIKALLDQLESGKLRSDKLRVLHYIKNNPGCTTSDVEIELMLIHQSASARINDLLDLGVIEESGEKQNGNRCYSTLCFQSNPAKQKQNASKRKAKKFRAWAKKGLSKFEEFITPEMAQNLRR